MWRRLSLFSKDFKTQLHLKTTASTLTNVKPRLCFVVDISIHVDCDVGPSRSLAHSLHHHSYHYDNQCCLRMPPSTDSSRLRLHCICSLAVPSGSGIRQSITQAISQSKKKSNKQAKNETISTIGHK